MVTLSIDQFNGFSIILREKRLAEYHHFGGVLINKKKGRPQLNAL